MPWTDTGINIAAGSQLDITASGIVAYGGSTDQTTDANGGIPSQEFFQNAVLPNTIIVSLIGKIGGTIDVGTGTPVPEGTPGDGPGFVGISYSEVTPTGGELFLGFNDQVGAFWDNSGSFSVTIDVVPVPEPSTVALSVLESWLSWSDPTSNRVGSHLDCQRLEKVLGLRLNQRFH